MKEKFT